MNVERQMVDTFIKAKGKKPESPQDWAEIMKMSYPNNDLPADLAKTSAASLYTAGFNKPTAAPVPSLQPAAPGAQPLKVSGPNDPNYLQSLTGNVNQAKGQMDQAFNQYDQMPSGNEALRILQEAIKAKAAPKDFAQAPIGESEIFKQAGVGGIGALSQSLAARGNELELNRADFANTVSKMADVYKTQAEGVQRRYENSVEQYKFASETLNRTMEQLRNNEQEMKLLSARSALDRQLEEIRHQNDLETRSVPTPGDLLSAADKGYMYRGGQLLEDNDLNRGIVAGFNIGRYATDPNHEKAIYNIVTNKIGKFNNEQDLASYISSSYPNSPVTAEMVMKASEKHQVPWEMVVAMMEQDSSLGTKGKGARTFNPGNVGNDDEGNIRNYGNWQAGVDAVALWLSKNRAAPKKVDPQLNAMDKFDKLKPSQQQAVQGVINRFSSQPAVVKYSEIGQALNSVRSMDNNTNNPADDQALIYTFARAMDPTSSVKEGEYDTIQKYAQPTLDKYKLNFNRIYKEGAAILTPAAREALKKTMEAKYNSQKQQYDSLKKEYGKNIDKYTGGGGEEMLIDFNFIPDVSQSNPSGTKLGDLDFKM